eukprot:Tbor_TRINITY_DN427_c0_g1::TRINITY_DN427_c0_g1_i1::g.3197::m.3197
MVGVLFVGAGRRDVTEKELRFCLLQFTPIVGDIRMRDLFSFVDLPSVEIATELQSRLNNFKINDRTVAVTVSQAKRSKKIDSKGSKRKRRSRSRSRSPTTLNNNGIRRGPRSRSPSDSCDQRGNYRYFSRVDSRQDVGQGMSALPIDYNGHNSHKNTTIVKSPNSAVRHIDNINLHAPCMRIDVFVKSLFSSSLVDLSSVDITQVLKGVPRNTDMPQDVTIPSVELFLALTSESQNKIIEKVFMDGISPDYVKKQIITAPTVTPSLVAEKTIATLQALPVIYVGDWLGANCYSPETIADVPPLVRQRLQEITGRP